jgi:hypothetical protein
MYFNVFEAAPENDRDGPSQQAAQNANGKVRICPPASCKDLINPRVSVTRILLIGVEGTGRWPVLRRGSSSAW